MYRVLESVPLTFSFVDADRQPDEPLWHMLCWKVIPEKQNEKDSFGTIFYFSPQYIYLSR